MKKFFSVILIFVMALSVITVSVAADEIEFQTMCETDFSKLADSELVSIPVDANKISTTTVPLRIGTSDVYINPPVTGTAVFNTPENAQILSGRLNLNLGNTGVFDANIHKECRFTWQPEDYQNVGDTYRFTIAGEVKNSNSGLIIRFNATTDANADGYVLLIPACGKHKNGPGWMLYKRENKVDTLIMSSGQLTSITTSGNGYLKTFNAEITVTDKNNISVHMTGKTNTKVAIDETVSYTDSEPFAHSLKDNYVQLVPYGSSDTTYISLLKLEGVATPKTSSYVTRQGDNYTVNTSFSSCDAGTTYVCGYKAGKLAAFTSRAYSSDKEEFNLSGDFEYLKVLMLDDDFNPITQAETLESPEKNVYEVIASADFREQTAVDAVYKIEADSYSYPLYSDDVQIGDSDFYLTPPVSEIGKIFTSNNDEKAMLVAGALKLQGGYVNLGDYANRECRTEWRPENYSDITNTYKVTFNAKNTDSNSGLTFRFQVNDQRDSYYQFTVYSCNKSKTKPAWDIVKVYETGDSTVLMGSEVLPTQATTGDGYLQTYTVSIAVTDKSIINVDVNGTTNTGKSFKEKKQYVDEAPFSQDAHDSYMHFKSYGSATSTASIYSVKLESDLNSSAEGTKQTIDYGNIETAETNKMTWKPYDKGYMTIVYDDNNDDLSPMFDITTGEYGFPICAAIPTKYIDKNPGVLEQIESSGGEILSHTASHSQLNFSSSWETIDNEFKNSYDLLTARGFNVNGIILSGGTNSDTSTAFGRAVEPLTAKYYKYSDLYGVSEQYRKRRDTFKGKTAEENKAIIDRMIRNKEWIVIYAHNLTEFPEDVMRETLSYAQEKQQEGLFDIVTYKHMYKTFGNFENPVDFGKNRYTVTFYGTDNSTLLGTASVLDGEAATAPAGYVAKKGYTFTGWSNSVDSVTGNMSVYAICTDDETGLPIDTTHENVMVQSFDSENPVLANAKRKILSDNALNISYLNGTSNSVAESTAVEGWLASNFDGISLSSENSGITGATTAEAALLLDKIYEEFVPDVVFVDLTDNDTASYAENKVWSKFDIKRQAEDIVRNIYGINQDADIVFILRNKDDGSGSYEAYAEIAEEYKNTGIGCIDLSGVNTENQNDEICAFLKTYLYDVYVPEGEADNHFGMIPETPIMRSPWTNKAFTPASEFAPLTATEGSALYASMIDENSAAPMIAPSSVVIGADSTAKFSFTGTGFAIAVGETSADSTFKYQIDGHGYKTVTVPAADYGRIITLENELSYYSHEIDFEFVNELEVGGIYSFGEDNGLSNIAALSIDDGPKAASTGLLLDVLKANDAHATFFSIGINVKDASGIIETSKELLTRVLDEGSEIGNHSNSAILPDDVTGIQKHFTMAQNKVYEAVGVYPSLYRSPGNAASDEIFEVIPLPMMNGYNIGSDWNAPDAGGTSMEGRINGITDNAEDGNIILIHDNVYNVEALETALPNIAAKGIKIVSVSELIRLRGYVAQAMRQYKAFGKDGPEIVAQHSSLDAE